MKKDQRCDLRVIDNYFDEEIFNQVLNFFAHEQTHWYLTTGISDPDGTAATSYDSSPLDSYFFCHPVYDHMLMRSTCFHKLIELIEGPFKRTLGTELNTITRIKCNLYPRTEIVNRHPWHIDSSEQPALRGALLMLNTCDGFTGFIDGTKVNSVANRIAFFDATEKHHSTSTSDQSYRMTLNINYV